MTLRNWKDMCFSTRFWKPCKYSCVHSNTDTLHSCAASPGKQRGDFHGAWHHQPGQDMDSSEPEWMSPARPGLSTTAPAGLFYTTFLSTSGFPWACYQNKKAGLRKSRMGDLMLKLTNALKWQSTPKSLCNSQQGFLHPVQQWPSHPRLPLHKAIQPPLYYTASQYWFLSWPCMAVHTFAQKTLSQWIQDTSKSFSSIGFPLEDKLHISRNC